MPARRPWSTRSFMPSGRRARRSPDMPTFSALAAASCGAAGAGAAETATVTKNARTCNGHGRVETNDRRIRELPLRLSFWQMESAVYAGIAPTESAAFSNGPAGSLQYPARHQFEQHGARAIILIVHFVQQLGVTHEPLVRRAKSADQGLRSAQWTNSIRFAVHRQPRLGNCGEVRGAPAAGERETVKQFQARRARNERVAHVLPLNLPDLAELGSVDAETDSQTRSKCCRGSRRQADKAIELRYGMKRAAGRDDAVRPTQAVDGSE